MYTDNDWGNLTKTYKSFRRKNNNFPETLEEYCKIVQKNQEVFHKITRARVKFYLNYYKSVRLQYLLI
jgi:uncharacterized membrane protein